MVVVRAALVLLELVSGRGTARPSRVVEGQSRLCFRTYVGHDSFQIRHHLTGRNPKRCNTRIGKPLVPSFVPLCPFAKVMGASINLNRQPRIAAEEVQNIDTAGVLPAEFQSAGPFPEFPPQQHFRQRHFPAQLSRPVDPARLRFGRNVSKHVNSPSTMLRMVPLPETSSGRI